ncbi:MAG: hypothetical protein OXE57_06070 [Alphaproteobacteria bacterium]|nr:hypothetical protein [Alphaproteobacteria bacterium]
MTERENELEAKLEEHMRLIADIEENIEKNKKERELLRASLRTQKDHCRKIEIEIRELRTKIEYPEISFDDKDILSKVIAERRSFEISNIDSRQKVAVKWLTEEIERQHLTYRIYTRGRWGLVAGATLLSPIVGAAMATKYGAENLQSPDYDIRRGLIGDSIQVTYNKPGISFDDKDALSKAITENLSFEVSDISSRQEVAVTWLEEEMKRQSRTYRIYRHGRWIYSGAMLTAAGATALGATAVLGPAGAIAGVAAIKIAALGSQDMLDRSGNTKDAEFDIRQGSIDDFVEVIYRKPA